MKEKDLKLPKLFMSL